MPSRFVSDEQRARYGRYTGDPNEEQLARHFHLEAADRELMAGMRGAHNRLGFAVPARDSALSRRLPGASVPDAARGSQGRARQLGESPTPGLDAYRGRQRWRHAATIRDHYGFRDLEQDPAAGFRLTRWLYVLCWTGDDRPGLLFDRVTTWLLAHKVLLPGISTLERLISRVRHRAALRLWRHLTQALTAEQREKLVALVTSDDETLATLEDLRAAPKRRSPMELLRHLERIDTCNAIALWNSTYIQATVDQLTREGWDISEADIARVSPLLFKHINFLGRYAFDLRRPSPKAPFALYATLLPNRIFA